MDEQYKTTIEDFRNLKPYYDLVFEIMAEVSKYCFQRDIRSTSRSLRELIINTAPYILDAKEKLERIEKELQKVFTAGLLDRESLSKAQEKNLDQLIDDYFKFIQKTRIEIHTELERMGFMPKMDKSRVKTQSEKTKGASI